MVTPFIGDGCSEFCKEEIRIEEPVGNIQNDNYSSSDNQVPIIVGSVVGGIFLIALILLLILFLLRRRRGKFLEFSLEFSENFLKQNLNIFVIT